jgi:LysM repeat protein
MIRKICSGLILILGIAVLSGCETTRGSQSSSSQTTMLRQQLARSQETARYYEAEVGKLKANYGSLVEGYNELSKRLNAMQGQLNALLQQNQQLQAATVSLQNALTAEQKARQESINKMVDKVASETSKAIESVNRSQGSSGGSGPVGSGQFYEYKVQSGATLSAIAKAYKVSVEDIRKANKLKNDIIYVGQKLYIPKK